MHYVQLTALRPLRGDWGNADEGDTFTTDNETAEMLETAGLAERYIERPPLPPLPPAFLAKMMAAPENKMVQPTENKAAEVQPAPRRNKRR